jgi:hypothetical protein
VIDERALRAAFAALQARVAYLERCCGLFATDADLASPKGNPTVRFELRDWRGPEQKGKRFSDCDPAFLDQLAEYLQWSADNPKEGKKQYAAGNRADAKRARTWARRIRAETSAAKSPSPNVEGRDDEDEDFLGLRLDTRACSRAPASPATACEPHRLDHDHTPRPSDRGRKERK